MDQFVPNSIDIKVVEAPASKSFAQRILLASAFSNQPLEIKNLGSCDDVLHIKSIVKQLGATIIENENSIIVTGKTIHEYKKNKTTLTELNCGESGLGIRLTTSIVAAIGGDFIISGEGSLLNRPLTQFEDFLPKMGINFSLNNGQLPMKLSGSLKGGEYTVNGSLSSQYISGLLMALPLAKENSILHVNSPTSKPYIDVTLNALEFFGIKIINENYTKYTILGNQDYIPKAKTIKVEGDWSGAAFWVVYGLIKGSITIRNLNRVSTQADIAILDIIKLVNGNFSWENDNLVISKGQLKPFTFDATHCPDLFPILVVLASAITGTSTITGVHRLKYKESDRGLVLETEFKKLGLKVKINGDNMDIIGTGYLNSGTIDSNNDHRIAMSGAIASALTKEGITILNANCVNKSYSEFWEIAL
jgi:3-phosphoshikimate 1-carboxyvinyltransferase